MKNWFNNLLNKKTVTTTKTTVSSSNGNISINGICYAGNSVSVNRGKVIIDGVDVTPDGKVITISVTGNVDTIKADACSSIIVGGDANVVDTSLGNVSCRDVKGNVTTTLGKVDCNNIDGSVETTLGNVKANEIKGSVKTSMGNISGKK